MTDEDWAAGVTARSAQYEINPTAMSTTRKLDTSSPPECAVGVGSSDVPPSSAGAAASTVESNAHTNSGSIWGMFRGVRALIDSPF